jgi:dephospho-CoA kinase
MKWFGITGGLGSGKSTVSRMLLQRGVPVLDADKIAKEVVEVGSPGLQQIIRDFGPGVLNSQGGLDRLKMAQIVFGDPERLKQLETIVHPLVQQAVRERRQWLEDQGSEFAFYDVPLLFEKNLQRDFDGILVVACSEEHQIQRLKKRNNWSDGEIQQRLKSQIPLSQKINGATFVLENDSDLGSLEIQVDKLLIDLKNVNT